MGVASIEEEQNLTWVVWGVVGLLDVKLVVVEGDVLPLVVDSGPGPGSHVMLDCGKGAVSGTRPETEK